MTLYCRFTQVNDYLASLFSRLSSRECYDFLDNPELLVQTQNKDNREKAEAVENNNNIANLIRAIVDLDTTATEDERIKQLEKSCLERFQDWSRDAQLRVGVLLYLDKRIDSGAYIARVVKHIAETTENLYDLLPHELVAICILFYLRYNCRCRRATEFSTCTFQGILDIGGVL